LNDAQTLADARTADRDIDDRRALDVDRADRDFDARDGDVAAVDIGISRPERIEDLASERESLSTFVEAVRAAGMTESLTGDRAYTVFAPTNEAFEEMSGLTREELLAPENRDRLVELLRAHIVADDLDRDMAARIPEAMTLDGRSVRVEVEGERFMFGDAAVVDADIERGNLRIHAIDRVQSDPAGVQVALADDDFDVDADVDINVDVDERETRFESDDPQLRIEDEEPILR
jgi:uncharacterized surface protein with fasciclin (FAS1) repeats